MEKKKWCLAFPPFRPCKVQYPTELHTYVYIHVHVYIFLKECPKEVPVCLGRSCVAIDLFGSLIFMLSGMEEIQFRKVSKCFFFFLICPNGFGEPLRIQCRKVH